MLPADFVELLRDNGVSLFCGVPDSLLKDLCAYIADNIDKRHNIVTANEGNAIALAAGHYLATSKPAVVYMQNSGEGNSVNPLLSLMDREVYNIPALLLIGWRGQPGVKDEPQHVTQGKLTDKLLKIMGVKHAMLPDTKAEAEVSMKKAFRYMVRTRCPFAFIVRKGVLDGYSPLGKRGGAECSLGREEAVRKVVDSLCHRDIVVATTGQISRELYEYRESRNDGHERDFLTVGSMGHASSIALGIALEKPGRRVFCFDGDGAMLMHLGALPVIASSGMLHFKHVVFNNEAHDSVGGQPTVARNMDIPSIALGCGYAKVYSVSTGAELDKILPEFMEQPGPTLLEIKVRCGARLNLGRPKEKPSENKAAFMGFLAR